MKKFKKYTDIYNTKGFFVLENYFTDDEVNYIYNRIQNLENNLDLSNSIYTLSESNNKVMRLEYFIKNDNSKYNKS